jgi:hypothetical protein
MMKLRVDAEQERLAWPDIYVRPQSGIPHMISDSRAVTTVSLISLEGLAVNRAVMPVITDTAYQH